MSQNQYQQAEDKAIVEICAKVCNLPKYSSEKYPSYTNYSQKVLDCYYNELELQLHPLLNIQMMITLTKAVARINVNEQNIKYNDNSI